MRRVQQGYTPITDFGGKKQVNFDALFSSDSEDESTTATASAPSPKEAPAPAPAAPPSPVYPYQREAFDDPISTWTQKVTESFEKVSQAKKPLSPDFKESLGRLSFFRKPVDREALISKEKTSTTSVHSQ